MESKDKTTITFYNGLRTIGGTLIEVRYQNSRVLFDFGSVYQPDQNDYGTDLLGYLNSGSIVYLDGLYDSALVDQSVRQAYATSADDAADFSQAAVFISHAHLDHSKMINYLNPAIPLYAASQTAAIIRQLNCDNHFLQPFSPAQQATGYTRHIHAVADSTPIQVGQIAVQFFAVDHDVLGASGLLIKTPNQTIAYTGDLRLHGYRPADTKAFCQAAAQCDVLLMEGTSVSRYEVGALEEEQNYRSEDDLIKQITTIVASNVNRALFFNYYIANVERIGHLIATLTPYREIVLSAAAAAVFKTLTGRDVKYYQLSDFDYQLNDDYRIDFSALLRDRSRFFWQLDQAALAYIDQLPAGGLYIHSDAVPLGPFDPSYEPFFQSFADAGIETHALGCSGHAYTTDLIRIIDWIQPKLLCPIHSFQPERLFNLHGKRLLPKKGQTIECR